MLKVGNEGIVCHAAKLKINPDLYQSGSCSDPDSEFPQQLRKTTASSVQTPLPPREESTASAISPPPSGVSPPPSGFSSSPPPHWRSLSSPCLCFSFCLCCFSSSLWRFLSCLMHPSRIFLLSASRSFVISARPLIASTRAECEQLAQNPLF